jgi:hypothetical protein
MNRKLPTLLIAMLAVTACTPNQKKHQWAVATEAEVAAALDAEFENAAKGFVKLKRDGQIVFCKRSRDVGSNIATLKCITEAQLRLQVENMTRYRDEMRHKGGRCTHGVGCSGGN